MKTSAKGLAEIAGHEGLCLSPYLDSVGVWTIGLGHTKAAGLPDPATLPKAPVEQAIKAVIDLFARDIAAVEERVTRAVKVPIAQHEFDALVSFDYNTGGVLRAQITARLNAGDRPGAIRGFDGWRKPPEIIPRRSREKELFANATYGNGGFATVFPVKSNNKPDYAKGRRVNILALLQSPTPPVQPPRPDWAPTQPTTPNPARSGFLSRLLAFFPLPI